MWYRTAQEKQPWEMTSHEFSRGKKAIPRGTRHHPNKMRLNLSDTEFVDFPTGDAGFDVERALEAYHSEKVREAFKRGESIPPEVLEQYPHLVRKQPWEMTSQEYMDQNYTGGIPTQAYQRYAEPGGLDWMKDLPNTETFHTVNLGGNEYEFRQDPTLLRYPKRHRTYNKETGKWEIGDFMRDENHELIYMTPEEIAERGLKERSGDIFVYHGDTPVGQASDEFGSTGIWVTRDHQSKGLGTELLKRFRERNPNLGPLGQMTQAGYNLSKAYHRQLAQEALAEGKPVPQEVLDSLHKSKRYDLENE